MLRALSQNGNILQRPLNRKLEDESDFKLQHLPIHFHIHFDSLYRHSSSRQETIAFPRNHHTFLATRVPSSCNPTHVPILRTVFTARTSVNVSTDRRAFVMINSTRLRRHFFFFYFTFLNVPQNVDYKRMIYARVIGK